MIATIILGVLCTFLAATAPLGGGRKALIASFGILFLFLSLRYNFGNDYKAYYNGFAEINRFPDVDYFDSETGFEPAWIWLCRLFSPLGFFSMVGFVAAFSCLVFWRFFVTYVPSRLVWITLFLFIVHPDNMLTQLSAMRQAVAILFIVLAIDSIINRDFIKYVFLVCIATLFHYSAAVCFLLYGLGRDFKLGRIVGLSIFSSFLAFIALSEEIVPVILQWLAVANDSASVERYVSYEEKGDVGSGLGLLYYGIYLISLLLTHNSQDRKGRLIVRMAVIGVCLVPLTITLAMLGRIGLYFSVFSTVAVPLVYVKISNRGVRIAYLLMHILFSVRAFMVFFEDPTFKDFYNSYITIFSAAEFVL